ncbi:NifU family protein [Nonomuraea lactucae]|uniref:NifU family protein n=1 Tax=Nonomuraea lactucae TaxID=2249762 RepID=UPI000DE4A0B8|nr:NifU family protein [Nonomuraea lactucae]
MNDDDLAERMRRIEALLDDDAGPRAVELAETLLDLYGEALSRVMAVVSAAGGGLPERVASDELVSHLLLLHGLHPLDARTRVEQAVERTLGQTLGQTAGQTAGQMAGQTAGRLDGAGVEVLAVEDDVVRLLVRRPREGCGSSARTLRSALEEAVRDAAPEIDRVEVEIEQSAPPPVVIPVESLLRASSRDRPGARA